MIEITKVESVEWMGAKVGNTIVKPSFNAFLIESCLRHGVPLEKIGYKRKCEYIKNGKIL